jgi:hypothetical protein
MINRDMKAEERARERVRQARKHLQRGEYGKAREILQATDHYLANKLLNEMEEYLFKKVIMSKQKQAAAVSPARSGRNWLALFFFGLLALFIGGLIGLYVVGGEALRQCLAAVVL